MRVKNMQIVTWAKTTCSSSWTNLFPGHVLLPTPNGATKKDLERDCWMAQIHLFRDCDVCEWDLGICDAPFCDGICDDCDVLQGHCSKSHLSGKNWAGFLKFSFFWLAIQVWHNTTDCNKENICYIIIL